MYVHVPLVPSTSFKLPPIPVYKKRALTKLGCWVRSKSSKKSETGNRIKQGGEI